MSSGLRKLKNQRAERRQAPPPDHPRKTYTRPPITVPLAKLAPNPHNPRQTMTEVDELAHSLRTVGQKQPVVAMTRAAYLALMPEDEAVVGDADLVVVAGSRRLAAAHHASLPELIVHVDDSPDSAALILEAAIVENMHRVDLHPLEEARSLEQLRDLLGLNQKELAERLGRTSAFISQRLSLLKLVPELQTEFLAGRVKVEQARSLARYDAADQWSQWEALINGVNGEGGAEGDSLPVARVPQPINAVNPDGTSSSPGGLEVDRHRDATQEGAEGSQPPLVQQATNGVNGEDGAAEGDNLPVARVPQPINAVNPEGESDRPRYEQLTLELTWEPEQIVDELHQRLGADKFNELATAILARATVQ
ncbi:ParB/RepB/Spo0J family partition protein [Nocardiopsis changdeensis]|uniref:ParB/RepB/Spo0J family partition protein n=1 Tax=Nocardiopsis changdeensis TaxID=2831969 RepID=A0A975KU04_9ACTN|nr:MULTISPECIES: ParB/RepB/Spo0J family partition protein [Nocardiopsis]QUX26477.1 ParB/RepB/Spo0J family partition protein [Nocardiopsis changdeensis]QYX40749.1 ParB/RepB/Spo0J family partition protein [Nocardiopsis sp. MT53]